GEREDGHGVAGVVYHVQPGGRGIHHQRGRRRGSNRQRDNGPRPRDVAAGRHGEHREVVAAAVGDVQPVARRVEAMVTNSDSVPPVAVLTPGGSGSPAAVSGNVDTTAPTVPTYSRLVGDATAVIVVRSAAVLLATFC